MVWRQQRSRIKLRLRTLLVFPPGLWSTAHSQHSAKLALTDSTTSRGKRRERWEMQIPKYSESTHSCWAWTNCLCVHRWIIWLSPACAVQGQIWNNFQLSKVVIVERGCAQQSYQHQALVRGKWRTVTTVLEEVSHCPSSSYFPPFRSYSPPGHLHYYSLDFIKGLHKWVHDGQGVGWSTVFRHGVLLLQGG